MHHDPHVIVSDALGRLQQALLAQDVEACVDCFVPDGALFGGGVGEDAHGHDELARTFAMVVDRGLSLEWEVDEAYCRIGSGGVDFVADATMVVGVLGRRSRRRRFTMSGSLRAHGTSYRFELFNGLDPILSAGLHLVG